ncbi:Dolichyl-phosphate-mannose-protein mannosyltransferase [Bryocella elongata]|uniref:Dolichyl-phosphate-mannose-protein mannosyltransferase n=1 Tax=Bryocella elongata TaxID=863522 RepID=A0A1H6AD10_9BACT|nr:glycosyltransferase family 39 protein [Bryocella elongata]SEG45636.1 Dolichyl-phosphate-mannose-protein mannosyltransferase [Bryocella elongata]
MADELGQSTEHRRTQSSAFRWQLSTVLSGLMLVVAAIFFALHFVHLAADFPNHSPWVDWSKYTDEGWYGDAAARKMLFGNWYFAGDFNPAVALPVWPLLEFALFKATGVSIVAARALTLCVFALGIAGFYVLICKFTRPRSEGSGRPLAAAITVLLLCVSPYFFVFERLAILEPLVVTLTVWALIAAAHLHPPHLRPWKNWLPSIALGLLLVGMILTKTTALFLVPAVAYMVWSRAGYRLRPALKLAALPGGLALGLWLAYFVLLVRPHYLADFHYLFSANGYTGIMLDPLEKVVLNTLTDGMWMGPVLYPAFFVVLGLSLFWRPRLFANPAFVALLLWAGGYFAFLGYHNNLQPRYYTVVAAPLTAIVALGIDAFRQASARRADILGGILAACAVLAIAVPDAIQQIGYVLHPEYTLLHAAQEVRSVVLSDPSHPELILSISGSDITMMTGLRSIDDDFGTMELVDRVKAYRPGWYVAWNELDDDKMDALSTIYRIQRVAAFPAMDDPDRNLLIVYRLDPKDATPPVKGRRRPLPKALRTRLGQQPSVDQLEH